MPDSFSTTSLAASLPSQDSAAALRLPPELVLEIIAHLAQPYLSYDQSHFRPNLQRVFAKCNEPGIFLPVKGQDTVEKSMKRARASLAACALVDKEWHGIANRTLWTCPWFAYATSASQGMTLFARSVRGQASGMPFVQGLRARLDDDNVEGCSQLVELLESLPRLKSATIVNINRMECPRIMAALASHHTLTSLSLSAHVFLKLDLDEIIPHLSSWANLSHTCIQSSEAQFWRPAITSEREASSSISSGSDGRETPPQSMQATSAPATVWLDLVEVSPTALRAALRPYARTGKLETVKLTNLRFLGTGSALMSVLVDVGQSLKSLEVAPAWFLCDETSRRPKLVLEYFSHLPTLEHAIFDSDLLLELHPIDVIEHLPLSLETLEILVDKWDVLTTGFSQSAGWVEGILSYQAMTCHGERRLKKVIITHPDRARSWNQETVDTVVKAGVAAGLEVAIRVA